MAGRYWHGLDRWVEPAGFGCWQLAGRYDVDGKPHGWSDIGADDAVALVHFALDRGIRFFDTAAAYGHGRSEDILGRALDRSAVAQEAIVCTKIALAPRHESAGRTPTDIAAQVEQALRRLRRDHVDLLLLHNPSDEVDWPNFDCSALDALRRSGKILAYGVSSRSLAGAERVLEAGFGSCIEWAFNLLERRPADRLFPRLREARMNFIARSPLSRGLLAGGRSKARPAGFPASDFRSTLPAAWLGWAAASAAKLEPSAGAKGLPDLALRYCLSFPEVSAVIPGMHQRRQVDALIAAAEAGPLDAAAMARVTALTEGCYPAWR